MIAKVASVPSPVQGRRKYLRVPARGENGFKIGYAKIRDIPIHVLQRLYTSLQTVSKPFCLIFRSGGQSLRVCGRAWACGTEGSGV